MPNEPIYYVDYIWDASSADPTAIIEIAELDKYWGKDIDEALVAVKNIQIDENNITMMKSNTVKITLPNGISIIKFRMPDEEYEELITTKPKINIVARCNRNEWNGNISAQLLLEEYEIVQEQRSIVDSWGF